MRIRAAVLPAGAWQILTGVVRAGVTRVWRARAERVILAAWTQPWNGPVRVL
jgi:hypothetical protein